MKSHLVILVLDTGIHALADETAAAPPVIRPSPNAHNSPTMPVEGPRNHLAPARRSARPIYE